MGRLPNDLRRFVGWEGGREASRGERGRDLEDGPQRPRRVARDTCNVPDGRVLFSPGCGRIGSHGLDQQEPAVRRTRGCSGGQRESGGYNPADALGGLHVASPSCWARLARDALREKGPQCQALSSRVRAVELPLALGRMARFGSLGPGIIHRGGCGQWAVRAGRFVNGLRSRVGRVGRVHVYMLRSRRFTWEIPIQHSVPFPGTICRRS